MLKNDDIGYRGHPMLPNEFGNLKWLVQKHGIERIVQFTMQMLKPEYWKKVMNTAIKSHWYFEKLYARYERPHNTPNPSPENNELGTLVYLITEYDFKHVLHALMLFVPKNDARKFFKKVQLGRGQFRKDNDSFFPLREIYPYPQQKSNTGNT